MTRWPAEIDLLQRRQAQARGFVVAGAEAGGGLDEDRDSGGFFRLAPPRRRDDDAADTDRVQVGLAATGPRFVRHVRVARRALPRAGSPREGRGGPVARFGRAEEDEPAVCRISLPVDRAA